MLTTFGIIWEIRLIKSQARIHRSLQALGLKTSKLVPTWDSQVTQNVNEGTEDVTRDAQIIARQSDKMCRNLRDQTWTWPNAQHLENQDFSRLGLKFRDYIPRNSGMIGIILRL